MKVLVAISFLSICFSSCVTKVKNPPELVNGHIIANCRIFETTGRLIRNLPGHLCYFNDDGTTVVTYGKSVVKYSSDFRPVWTTKTVWTHHQLKKGEFSGNYLLLDSALSSRQNRQFRSDVLLIINPEGEVIKSLNFKKVLKHLHDQKIGVRSHTRAHWMENGSTSGIKSYEESHVNSFYEYFEMRDGVRQFAGYVANCYHQKKIIFLDKELQKVTRVIDVGTRAIHDVQMKDPGKLFFYQNYFEFRTYPRISSLVEFDLETEKFTELYSAKSEELSSRACGSVQHLGNNRFVLAHSNCAPATHAVFQPLIEVIDLNTAAHSIIKFPKGTVMSSAEIRDLSSYLKSNSGM